MATPQHKRPERKCPQRKCIVSGEVKPVGELIRFVIGPNNDVVPDIDGRLPGRGIWTDASRDAVALAVKKRMFDRAARQKVLVDATLPDLIERNLTRKTVEILGLARKAGAAICGFQKVDALIRRERPFLLLEASDGAADGRRKLTSLLKKYENHKKGPIPVVDCLKSDELGLAFGRGSVIHAALTPHGLSERLLSECSRLGGFRRDASAADGPGECAPGT